jgi:hypothetical protein
MTALRLLPEFEEALRAVPGIRQASVVTTAEAEPIEVHVVADTAKPAKNYVRDVQAVGQAQFDLDVDHRIVSIVQIPPGQADPAEAGSVEAPAAPEAEADQALPRPALTSIAVHRAGSDAEVTVQLAISGEVFTGVATGPSAPIHRPRIVAQATLSALTELLGIPCQIESAQVLEIGLRQVAISTLMVSIPRLGEQVLCGSALVRGDAEDAIARSVLAAVNRRLSG